MSDFRNHIREVVKLTLGGLYDENNGFDFLQYRHPDYPLLVGFVQQGNLDKTGKIVVRTSSPRVAGSKNSYPLHNYMQNYKTPRRVIRADRFCSQPERVASEIKANVIEPATSAAIQAMKELADTYAVQQQQRDLVTQICGILGRKVPDKERWNETTYIDLLASRENGYGHLQIRDSGYIELNMKSIDPALALDLAHAFATLRKKYDQQ